MDEKQQKHILMLRGKKNPLKKDKLNQYSGDEVIS